MSLVAVLGFAACTNRPAADRSTTTTAASSSPSSSSTSVAGLADLQAAREVWSSTGPASYRLVVTSYGRVGQIRCEYRVEDGAATVLSGPTRIAPDGTTAATDRPGCEAWASTVEAQLDQLERLLREIPGFAVTYDDRGVPVSVTAPGDPAEDGGGRTELEVLE